ncbi:MAG: hypothetical protein D3910_19190, partial [Candidatus Electrothrix sp. ATG2]|nr:hypothetical protein [Candidatus Electrothrix sp. ATG2]
MNSSLGSEIVTGFIEEVEGYLPDMTRCLQTLQQDRAHRPSLAELHRITHTIKGAAAMVGLDELSGIGEVLEKVMENVLGASFVLDDETISLLGDATQRIDNYCVMQRAGTPDEQLFQNTLAEIEKKLCQSTVEADEGSAEQINPEAIFYDQEIETAPEAASDNLDSVQSFFEDDTETSEKADTDRFLDELSFSASPAAEEEGEDFFPPDTEDEEADDLFGSSFASEQDESVRSLEAQEVDQDDSAAEAIDPELLQCFCEETEEHLENIDTCLNSLDDQITEAVELNPTTQETLHSLRRSVHTLKGAAAVIGIEPVAAWGHDFEDFLDWLHDEARRLDPSTISALRDGADLLASLAEDPTFSAAKEQQRITAKFSEITNAFSSGLTVGQDVGEAESSLIFDETESPLELAE